MMKLLDWRKWSLTVSLAATMTVLIIVAVTSVTLLSVNREKANFRNELQGQARVIIATLEQAILNPLFNLDTNALADQLDAFGDADVFVAGQVYDPSGRLIVDETGDPAFSMAVDPFAEELLASDDTVFQWNPDNLLAGKAVRLGSRTIGAISIELPTTALIDKTNAANEQGITVALVAGVIGVIISLLISRTITLPLRSMMGATQRIAEGDLGHRVTVNSGGELIALSNAFNDMTARLQTNIEQLEQRTQEVNRSNSELEGTNKALEVARDEALEASRIKDEFLATMSHELRTPLTAIIGFGGIMLEGMGGEVDDAARNMIQSMYDNGQHLIGLINDILDIAKIEAGRLEIVPAPMNTRQTIEEWHTRTRVLADKKNIDLEIEIDSALPESVNGDKERITQIVYNLLSNAVKFTDEGQVTLNAAWQDNAWVIKVTDTGIGIPPHALQYVFDEFRQVDGSSRRKHQGTGLGLAIVHKLCKLMDGEVTVTSQSGAGSVFTATLPVKVITAEEV